MNFLVIFHSFSSDNSNGTPIEKQCQKCYKYIKFNMGVL